MIRGNLKVYSPAPPEIAPPAQVSSRLAYIQVEREGCGEILVLGLGLFVLALSLVRLVAIFLATKWADDVAAIFQQRPGATLLTGLGGISILSVSKRD